MLALVSTSSTIVRDGVSSVRSASERRKGRAKAMASSSRANARSNNRSKLSSRERRVMRGGEGERNIKELNGISPRGRRWIK